MEGLIEIQAPLALVLVMVFSAVSFMLGFIIGKYRERVKGNDLEL